MSMTFMLSDSVILASTILVVDDEEFLLEYVRIVLLRSGFTVLTAQTGEDAWHLILHSQNEIRLVLTDIVMPGSFDGFELADRVRRRQPDLPVLFMTGAALDDHASDALVSKRLLLRKPFGPEQLLAIVRENLEAASPSTQGS
jgi:DNA-binding response OmpR family regulator